MNMVEDVLRRKAGSAVRELEDALEQLDERSTVQARIVSALKTLHEITENVPFELGEHEARLRVDVVGVTADDLAFALEHVAKLARDGYKEGADASEFSRYGFDILNWEALDG